MTPGSGDLEARLVSLNRVMRAHRGGVELAGAGASGEPVLAFVGMCTGCTYRPVCAETIVRPALEDLPGIERIHVHGLRVNEDNRNDLRTSLSAGP